LEEGGKMSGKQKILIVDDDMHIAELVSLYVEKEGFETKEVHDGREAIQMVSAFQPDLILLDLMLPGMDGYQVCAEIRKTSRVPVIMLTAKGETFDKVLGLELGADDYIVKPFDPKELVARVKAVLRRYEPQQEEGDILRFPNLEINISNYSVTYHGRGLEFPPKEFELLFYLAKHPNRVFTREQLLDQIWGYEYVGDTRTVDVHVKRIREKLNQEDEWGIRTVWSVGYKFGQK
jgi:DNA-binding response OmpR family regulator